MRKKISFSAFFALFFGILISKNSFAAQNLISISKISGTNGAEFIEISNESENSFKNVVKITKGTGRAVFFENEIEISAGESIKITQENSKYVFSGDHIGEKANILIFAGEEILAHFCSAGESECSKNGVSRNSTDLKSGFTAVFGEKIKPSDARKGYTYGLFKDEEIEKSAEDSRSDEAEPDAKSNSADSGEPENSENDDLNNETTPNDSKNENPESADSGNFEDQGEDSSKENDDDEISGESENNLNNGDVENSDNSENSEIEDGGENSNSENLLNENPLNDGEIEEKPDFLGDSSDDFENGNNPENLSDEISNGEENGAADETENSNDETAPSDSKNENPAPKNPENPENPTPAPRENFCRDFRIWEIFANSNAQFIELKNISNAKKTLSNCAISSSARGSADYIFGEIEVEAGGFFALKIPETKLKINKTTAGEIFLLDGEKNEIQSVKFEKMKPETSWAFFENGEKWAETFEITPNVENIFAEFSPCAAGFFRSAQSGKCEKNKTSIAEVLKICPPDSFLNFETNRCKKIEIAKNEACAAGYFRNPETGRCKKIEAEKSQIPCAAGFYRAETGRCRKIEAANAGEKTPCAEGYFRNPATNRCKKIESEDENLAPCKEGFERNPETNRCRKKAENHGAGDAVKAENSQKNSEFSGWWAIFGVIFAMILVLAWEFRSGILAIFRKAKK